MRNKKSHPKHKLNLKIDWFHFLIFFFLWPMGCSADYISFSIPLSFGVSFTSPLIMKRFLVDHPVFVIPQSFEWKKATEV